MCEPKQYVNVKVQVLHEATKQSPKGNGDEKQSFRDQCQGTLGRHRRFRACRVFHGSCRRASDFAFVLFVKAEDIPVATFAARGKKREDEKTHPS